MAVDEFGREVPAGRGGGGGGGRRGEEGAGSPAHYNNGGGAGPEDNPSFLNEALPTSRYEGSGAPPPPPHHHRDHHYGGDRGGSRDGGGGGRDQQHHHHHHPSETRRHHRDNNNHSSQPHHHQQPYNNNNHHDNNNNNNNNHRDTHRRKRKHRDESPVGRSSQHQHHPRGSRGKSSSAPHPSTLYAEEPMMCQFLWKESKGKKKDDDDTAADDDAGSDNEEKPTKDKEVEGGDATGASVSDDNPMNDDDHDEKTKEEEDDAYEEYRKGYSLNYIRMFFNQHMDDSWFRHMYSPLEEKRVAVQERQRATKEARAFQKELETSIAKNQATATTSTGANATTSDKNSPCFFVLKARLGGGIKQQTNTTQSSSNHHHHSSSLSNPVPGTHVMTLAHQVFPIQEVPPHVTDDQLVTALMGHVKDLKASDLQLFSSSAPGHGNLFRTTYVQCTEVIRKEIMTQLNHVDKAPTTDAAAAAAHVPRKEETFIPKTLQLEVECSDAYGRTEVDSDGKGGTAPADDAAEGVPSRKATVWVSTQATAKLISPHVAVLSAAVSSKIHIAKDVQAARTIAKAYDIRRNIPKDARLEAILATALPTLAQDAASPQDLEDSLDLGIAYLRRVHLFSFYNGCARANRIGDVLNGNHATSTIHLRLGIADEILQQAAKEDVDVAAAAANEAAGDDDDDESEPPKKKVVDLLVQRHELSIEEALKEAQPWLDDPDQWSSVVLSPDKDAAAKAIENDEQQVEPAWIQDHAAIDEDGRARCSFHFCRKLFKDSTFLRKHLIKKHSEFLKAERAKCHDQSMMEAWDAQEQRPVPPVLVDCGRAFSMVPSPVVGAAVPLADDPEPELWRRQEARRQEEEQIRRERQERFQPPDLDGPLHEERNSGPPPPRENNNTPRNSNFVDVDDMKEEKIELAFDNVEAILPPKKKKRKKKLL
jgi:hypothetical protein